MGGCNEICTNKEVIRFENENLKIINLEKLILEIKNEDCSTTSGIIEKSTDSWNKVFKTVISCPKKVSEYYKKQFIINPELNKQFEDNFFRPITQSILDPKMTNSQLNNDQIQILLSYKFKKYSEIFRTNYNLNKFFSFDIKSKISFGPLINLNIFNCLRFLSFYKPRIENMFSVLDFQKAFIVKLIINGKIKMVLIDEYIATFQVNDKLFIPAFIRSNIKYSWINIIEKALAKVFNSYSNIFNLKSSQIYPFLSEAPLIEYLHDPNKEEKKNLWNLFFKASSKNWLIFSELKEENHVDAFSNDSIYVISAFQAINEKLVKIFFPTKMYDKMISIFKVNFKHEFYKEELYIKESEVNSKQVLLITFEDYYNILKNTFILKYEESYYYYFTKYAVKNSNYQVVKMRIKKNTKLTLSMHLKNKKLLSRMIVIKLNETFTQDNDSFNTENKKLNMSNGDFTFDYINSSFGKVAIHNVELNLDEGIYYVLFNVSNIESNKSIVLSLYSEFDLKLEMKFNEDEMKLFEISNKINECYLSIFNSYMSKGKKNVIKDCEDFNIISSVNDSKFGFSCFEIQNFSKSKILTVNIENNYDGMYLISHVTKGKSDSTKLEKNFNDVLKVYNERKEILIFEWQKTVSDINLNFFPKLYTEYIHFDKEKLNKIENFHKKIISNDIYYYEIPYKNKIYLVFCNQNTKIDYKLEAEINQLTNLVINNKNILSNQIKLNLKKSSKEIISMKVINVQEESSYKINFSHEKQK